MRFTSRNTVAALVWAALATLTGTPALADTPDTVGRIASVHGLVTIAGANEASAAASLNWPVASGDTLSTVRGAETEFRVGGAAVRLDGESDLTLEQLDDNSFRLRLSRGSVAVRIADRALPDGFELNAGDARVVLLEPGWVRVDTARQPGAITVSVLAGAAQVDGPGSSLEVPAGRRAELAHGDLLTGSLERDRFDDWAEPRQSTALQYVSPEVTGYEELDRYGSWSDNAEYGPLWAPRGIPAGWSPYQDGRWIWRDAWGWTWIDNAPWGYAPSHYGSWVQIGPSWRWAPGRGRPRPVWAPAVVGWHGNYPDRPRGSGYGARGPRPAVGWFPLKPRDNFVPGYRASPDYARRVDDYRRGRGDAGRPPRGGANPGRGFDPQRGWNGARPDTMGTLPAGQVPQARSRPQIRPAGDGPRDSRFQQGQMEAGPGQQQSLQGRESANRLLQTETSAAGAFAAQPVNQRVPARQESDRREMDRRQNERLQSERLQSERQQSERQQNERQQSERQQQARQQMERQQNERQQMERQQMERQQSDRQQMERQRAQAVQRSQQQQPSQPPQPQSQLQQRAQQQQPQPQQPQQPPARPQAQPSAQQPGQQQGQLQRRSEIRSEQQKAGQNAPRQMER